MTKTISVRLPKELADHMSNLAKSIGRTKTYYIQEALFDKVGDLEMAYLAQKRDEDIRAGYSKTYLLEEVIAENDLSDQV